MGQRQKVAEFLLRGMKIFSDPNFAFPLFTGHLLAFLGPISPRHHT